MPYVKSVVSSVLLLLLLLLLSSAAWSGDLVAPAAPTSPDSAMYTLEDIFNRLDSGTAGSKRVGAFVEPGAGPVAGTGKTLDEVMGKAPAVDDADGAGVANVLAGKTFWGLLSGGGWGLQTGTLASQTPTNTTVEQQAGIYEAFNLSTVDTDLATGNIRAGVTIFGIAGKAEVVDTVTGDAVAGDILSGRKAWVKGHEITGSAAAGDNVTGAAGSRTIPIPDGLYSGGKTATANDPNLQAGNIRNNVVIFGIAGTADVPSGTAVAADVLTEKTFSSAGGVDISGSMPNVGKQDITPGTSAQTITQGYHDGTGTVAGDADLVSGNIRSGVTIFGVTGDSNVVNTSSGDAAAGDIRTGRKAWVDGAEVTGTLDPDAIPCTGTRWSNTGIDPAGRWCDNGDGTVTDLLGYNSRGKGLVWLKDAGWGGEKYWRVDGDSIIIIGGNPYPNYPFYDDAHARAGFFGAADVAGLNDGSDRGDWRLPTWKELEALTQGTHQIRAGTPGPFDRVQSDDYWSSTSNASTNRIFAYIVNMSDGNMSNAKFKNETCHVWPVRAGQ